MVFTKRWRIAVDDSRFQDTVTQEYGDLYPESSQGDDAQRVSIVLAQIFIRLYSPETQIDK